MFATLAATLLLGTAGPAVVTSDPATAVVDPKKMSQAEIRAHNATLPRTHPNYIRCVRSAAIGSLVARNYSCRTVAQGTRLTALVMMKCAGLPMPWPARRPTQTSCRWRRVSWPGG